MTIKFHSMKERWGDIDGVNMFFYTHVIYKSRHEYLSARVPGRYASPAQLPSPEPCLLQRVDDAAVWPPFEPGMQVCESPEKRGLHVKRPCVADYDGSPALSQYVIHEARICHVLRRNPHPCIAAFHGCTVGRKGEITGLCFDKYTESLAQRMRYGFPVDTDRCMAQIHDAVAHLHGMNLVHNDIVAENVMFKSFGPALALVDFDSCAIRGYGLPTKHGPAPPKACSSEFENDFLGMDLIYKQLLQHERDTNGAQAF